jgi:hypothetical protein
MIARRNVRLSGSGPRTGGLSGPGGWNRHSPAPRTKGSRRACDGGS